MKKIIKEKRDKQVSVRISTRRSVKGNFNIGKKRSTEQKRKANTNKTENQNADNKMKGKKQELRSHFRNS